MVVVVLAFFILATPRSVAQDKPQLKRPSNDLPEIKPEETKKAKKVKGPRAVGLLQLSSGGKGTLIPIAILVDGKFYDASSYKADPVPMALDVGTVYEVEQGGDSQGLFTVNGALHSKAAGSQNPWVGAGAYLPNGTEAAKSTRKAENVPVGLDNSDSDAPPRLTRGGESKAGAAANPSPGSASSPTAGAGSAEKTGSEAPAQPPTRSSAGAPNGQGTPKPAGSSDPDKPGDKSAKEPTGAEAPPGAGSESSAGQSSSGPTPPGQSGKDYYRPTLRRGKPTQSAPEEQEPEAKVAKVGPPAAAGTAVTGAVVTGAVQLIPAISDAGGPDPRSYKFFWKTGEEEDRRKEMLALAGNEVQAYANALARNRIPAKPVPKATAGVHKTVAKPVQPVFENVQFQAFDVWGNSQPVMVLSAEAHMPTGPGDGAAGESFSITLVARTDIYGSLRKMYAGVTDKFHLDVTPRLELIDVVDADGDGRGELLFRETTDAGSAYVIYRATADKLWKMYDSRGE
jgi:hypothetical protein